MEAHATVVGERGFRDRLDELDRARAAFAIDGRHVGIDGSSPFDP
jgi:hypothetical protein